MARLTAFELEAIARAQGCECYDDGRQKSDRCTKKIIRCNGRLAWHRNNDETFRKVWQIDAAPEVKPCSK